MGTKKLDALDRELRLVRLYLSQPGGVRLDPALIAAYLKTLESMVLGLSDEQGDLQIALSRTLDEKNGSRGGMNEVAFTQFILNQLVTRLSYARECSNK